MSSVKYQLGVQKKSGIISGIILTLLGLMYSTFQTQFIIKTLKKEFKKQY